MDNQMSELHKGLAEFLKKLPDTLPFQPNAILIISGHWEETEFTVMDGETPGMIYDYGGFPESTYQVHYRAPGSPSVAHQVVTLAAKAGITIKTDSNRGFDHGTFVPLSVAYPGAQIPVVQFSMNKSYSPEAHYQLGKALAPLRNEGILIIGSGSSFHNLRIFGPGARLPSQAFDEWLTETMSSESTERKNRLLRWAEAPSARLAHPREDHLIPLMVIAGAAEMELATRPYHETEFFGGITMSSFRLG
jgi:aromatic ring-opening dioxygenase catalytic subunit (LigB family)